MRSVGHVEEELRKLHGIADLYFTGSLSGEGHFVSIIGCTKAIGKCTERERRRLANFDWKEMEYRASHISNRGAGERLGRVGVLEKH